MILYFLFAIPLLLFVAFVGAFFIAGIMDWMHYRRNRLFIELSRDHSKPRRPAAK